MRTLRVVHVLKEAILPSHDAAAVNMTMKLTAPRIVGARILLNIPSSRHMVDQMMKSLRRELDEVKNTMKGKPAMNLYGMLGRIDSPFTSIVLEDPLDHIGAFKTILNLQQTPDKVICRSFPTTLKGVTKVWFSKLPTSSITNFE